MLRFALIGALVLGCSDGGGMGTPDAAPDGLQCVDPASCDDHNSCTTDSATCSACQHAPVANCCGNGIVEAGEDCDDGNQQDFDGCSSDCRYEVGFVLKTITVLDGSQGCDLTGRGGIDNIFGTNANAPTRQTMSDLMTNSNLAHVEFVSLWRVRTHDPTLAAPFDLSFLLGQDTVASSMNYFTGQERFYVRPEYLPAAEVAGSSPSGVFTVAAPMVIIPMPWIWAAPDHFPLDIRRASFTGTLPNIRLCGALTAASWHRLPNLLPGTEGATLLDLFVLGTQLASYRVIPTQPDIDVDGDGLETFRDTDNDQRIDLCIDGDGTQILGTDCPLDPRIADAYSEAFDLEIVPAKLAGKSP
jgi:cysteine-rich repeat protein